MKTAIYLFFATTILIGCRKAPSGVTLSVDKTTIKLGEKATLTPTVDGKVTWVAVLRKGPNASEFSETQGGAAVLPFTFDTDTINTSATTGVYTFYVEARNCKSNPDKKCKSIKSNEVSVTVTP